MVQTAYEIKVQQILAYMIKKEYFVVEFRQDSIK